MLQSESLNSNIKRHVMLIVDSHCHLVSSGHERQPKDLNTILKNAKMMDVGYMLAISTCMSDIKPNLEIAHAHKHIFCSVGVHPSHANEPCDLKLITNILQDKKVVGIGEVGLDYSYNTNMPCKKAQQNLLCHMLSLFQLSKLPYIFHARNCFPDIFDILSEYKNIRGVFHCYTDSVENARKILDKEFYISISGIITFKNSGDLREILRYIPNDRLLIETDSPYLAPVPFRGQTNEPAYVRLVAERVAEEKKMSLEEIAKVTTENFFKVFRKPFSRM